MKATKKLVILAADHAGLRLKNEVKDWLAAHDYALHDFGAFDEQSSDYPDFILPAAEAVAKAKSRSVGIFFGGSGIGECIAANKVRGIRAALVYDAYTARKSREHNDANILCLGGRTVTGKSALAKRLTAIWLQTRFSGAARHVRRLKKISDFEKRC